MATRARQILDAADCSQAKLAAKVPGLYPMALTRHMREPDEDGAYPPDEQRVRAINRAAAKLAGLPEVETYLTVLALLDGLLPPRSDDLTFDALRDFVAELEPYFEGGAANAVVDAWEKLRRFLASRYPRRAYRRPRRGACTAVARQAATVVESRSLS